MDVRSSSFFFFFLVARWSNVSRFVALRRLSLYLKRPHRVFCLICLVGFFAPDRKGCWVPAHEFDASREQANNV
jgi:hypothetical protein